MKVKTWKKVLLYLSLIALTAAFAFPVYWMILNSVKPNEDIMKLPLSFISERGRIFSEFLYIYPFLQ